MYRLCIKNESAIENTQCSVVCVFSPVQIVSRIFVILLPRACGAHHARAVTAVRLRERRTVHIRPSSQLLLRRDGGVARQRVRVFLAEQGTLAGARPAHDHGRAAHRRGEAEPSQQPSRGGILVPDHRQREGCLPVLADGGLEARPLPRAGQVRTNPLRQHDRRGAVLVAALHPLELRHPHHVRAAEGRAKQPRPAIPLQLGVEPVDGSLDAGLYVAQRLCEVLGRHGGQLLLIDVVQVRVLGLEAADLARQHQALCRRADHHLEQAEGGLAREEGETARALCVEQVEQLLLVGRLVGPVCPADDAAAVGNNLSGRSPQRRDLARRA
mmetsp:Transcript_34352/g.107968  ORF Transcript_34352/g.107968 Transcript_34352/m.107968 type:complete len:327 (-) Transcript_34352:255-1235(-)